MGGSYHYHAAAKRFYIDLWWQGKRYRIWNDDGKPIWAEQTASKLLSNIRYEIDHGTFLIKSYLPDSPVSLKKLSKEWLKVLSVAPATKKFYEKAIGHAIKYFGEDQDIRKFHHSQLQTFYNDLPLTVKGKYHVLNTLKTMLRFAYQDEIIKKVPPFPKLPQGQKDAIKYLTYEEQQRVLSFIPDRHRGVFELAMEYGLRIGEVCALQWDCVTDTEIIIKRAMSDGKLRESTKTGRERRYGITERANKIFNGRSKSRGGKYVFTRADSKHSDSRKVDAGPGGSSCKIVECNDGGLAYTWKSLTCWWRSATKKAGITINLYNGIRHSLGCQLMDEGVEMEMVRDVLGHTSTNTTRLYAKRSSASVTNVLSFRGRLEDGKTAKSAVKSQSNQG